MNDIFLKILNEELLVAKGCTEPISIAFTCANLTKVLGGIPEKLELHCSPSLIKNANCVDIPNSDGLKGVEASALLGLLLDSDKQLQIFTSINNQTIIDYHALKQRQIYSLHKLSSNISLHIIVRGTLNGNIAEVELKYFHTNIHSIKLNNVFLKNGVDNDNSDHGVLTTRSHLNFKSIFEYVMNCDVSKYIELLTTQIDNNMSIANEGFTVPYGVGIGQTLLKYEGNTVYGKIKAYTASGSETRMCGSIMPVTINSGSGNQGIICSVPLVIYAKEKGYEQNDLYRGLIFSNLLNIYMKSKIGRLSAFCGAVNAAIAAMSGITFMMSKDYQMTQNTIINTIANIPGIICDGAKASCGAKIATSLDGAILGHQLAIEGKNYQGNTGILKDDIIETIDAVCAIGADGMCETNEIIMEILMNK